MFPNGASCHIDELASVVDGTIRTALDAGWGYNYNNIVLH
jgi:hypothetical protein